jgi:hypothetical protein
MSAANAKFEPETPALGKRTEAPEMQSETENGQIVG